MPAKANSSDPTMQWGVDALGAENTRKQGSEHPMSSQRTKPLATRRLNRVQFNEIFQRVIEKQNKDDYQLLAIMYPSMITAHGLLRAIESRFEQARQQRERGAVLDFMQEWVLSGQLDDSLLLEMEDFINGQSPSTHSLGPQMASIKSLIGRHLRLSSQSSSTFSLSDGKDPRKHQKAVREVASMRGSDITQVSQALCNLELESYAKLTIQSAVKTLATWRDNPEASSHQLFPSFAEKVSKSWVLTWEHS